ncbi:TPA: type VI secretion system baseplate subunit TssK [Enterobacter cloacae]|uniref:type VI secretion system baseplate subunit TssK n=1 Tax=Enterobacter TaxID=547 RepID=UPI001231A5CE|nr:type VI secretion system baseplate subunit TssK [Enterobacter cloacae]HCM9270908.1 type VI secretion system baseplate subunit TssK [Enterobacter cloacae subsp. cloacae]EMB9644425.1 type VI secretion system baseplate subunit TssK [Enterobacter cloacae]KAA5943522.1 type VI secretion system baseplate subunit TssK [Enterobacter cloacae]HAS1022685.1 type VI secretion system baseplate subunit TssK [Enterobacter cloacae]HAS1058736.1 type VI secretion system baseplate subunit TssK [Enterobacter clo
MKIFRPLWEDGAFLAPQQFQQQAIWDAHMADTVARMGLAQPWGVVAAEFDDSLLALSRLNATRLTVRFPDGTLIDTDLSDNLPPVCDLSAASDRTTVDIVLALPLLSANGGNLDDGSDSERPRRWKAERVTVQELAGHERSELAVLRHSLTLRMAHQENAAYLACPVTRLVRDAQGLWRRDSSFIPPLLALSACPALVCDLSDLLHRLQARRQRLMSMRRESNARLADFAVADVSLFWLLNALNSAEPVLAELLAVPDRHPELVYRELARLAGSLLTFSLEHDTRDIPAYRHDAPEQVFPPLLSLLDKLLEASLPSRVVSIELKQDGVMWKGALHDARLREGADFWLSVRSAMPAHELQTKFPQLCKAGSPDDVSEVVNVALSGMVIRPVTHVPAAIPLRLENQYFALDLSTDAARAMLDAGNCTFYTPASLGEVKLELFAVLRT